MLNHIETLVMNLLFNLLSIYVYQFWMDQKTRTFKQQKVMIFLMCIGSILLSMTFPIHINDEFIMDLRAIPLLVGSLYGGPIVSMPLLIVVIIYRSIIGGSGLYSAIVTATGTVLLSLSVYRQYFKWAIKVRIGWMMLLSLICSLYVLIVMQEGFGVTSVSNIHIWVAFCTVHVLGSAIVCLSIEHILKQHTLKKKIQLSEKTELVSHLAASISHEVRNPLMVSRGFMQLLKGDINEKKKHEYIDIALSELGRAERIINDYLTFAKPLTDTNQNLDVAEQCRHVIDIIQPLANMNSVKLHTHYQYGHIKGEPVAFQQCLLNLIKNGIEAMTNGGSLSLVIKSKEHHMVITIKDTGIGMTKEQLSRLGEPYFSTKGSKGTGLGMMVVQQIIREMNGTLQVESEVGVGSSFIIEFPKVNLLEHSMSSSNMETA